jgi:uncharacterized protein (TIGR00251 family)
MSKPLPATTWSCLRVEGQGAAARCVLNISVSPNAKRTEVVGWHDGALRIRLAAPPVDGAANEALRKWLAKALKLPQSKVELLRGASGRRKQWSIDAEATQVEGWLEQQAALQNASPDPESA